MTTSFEVKIVQLQPMYVACFPAYGPEPEDEAWQKLEAWARPLGLLDDPEKHRIFGFDTAGQVPGSDSRGYEFWIEVGPGFEAAGDAKIKLFSGGKYVVYRIPKVGNPWETIPSSWKALVLWQEDSPYKMGKAQCLEQPIGSAKTPMTERPMDLFLSIE
ncbi:MAG TPA: GyrI-like domain-containing protein [Anaerolineales bacterium]|nr:GyrI-like domain-containing protein [Anaerolineales bacterium]